MKTEEHEVFDNQKFIFILVSEDVSLMSNNDNRAKEN